MNIEQLTDDQLKAILLTCDGQGKSAKEEALNELLSRRFDEGYGCGSNVQDETRREMAR
jgi:hypothetical protein